MSEFYDLFNYMFVLFFFVYIGKIIRILLDCILFYFKNKRSRKYKYFIFIFVKIWLFMWCNV